MLTIFEYLRKRAFESVVAGVEDAVEALEHQPRGNSTTRPRTATPENSNPGISSEGNSLPAESAGQKYLAAPRSNATPTATPTAGTNTPDLPPRRRRGRPRLQDQQP